MIISIKNNWQKAEANHKDWFIKLVRNKLSLVNNSGRKKFTSKALIDFINDNLEKIAIGTPQDLEELIADSNERLSKIKSRYQEAFHKQAREIFKYEEFCKKGKTWNAYSLLALSPCQICPYCQQAFAFTVVGPISSFRPTLDHYFSKTIYPYLAISLNNLVPSCYTCNSSLKHNKDFFKEKHLNPLADHEQINFKLETDDITSFLNLLHDGPAFQAKGKVVVEAKSEQAKNSVKTFLLNERFVGNLSTLARFIIVKRIWSSDKVAELEKLLGDKISQSTVLQFDSAHYQDFMLGKMLKDINKQFSKS